MWEDEVMPLRDPLSGSPYIESVSGREGSEVLFATAFAELPQLDLMCESTPEFLRGLEDEGQQKDLKLSPNGNQGHDTSKVLTDMEAELEASGDLSKDRVTQNTSTPLQKAQKGNFQDWNRTIIESGSDTMSQGTASTKRSRGSRGGRGNNSNKRKDISGGDGNSIKARRNENGVRVEIRQPLLDVGPDVGMGLPAATAGMEKTKSGPTSTDPGQPSTSSGTNFRSSIPTGGLSYIADLLNQRKGEHVKGLGKTSSNGMVIHNFRWTKRSEVVSTPNDEMEVDDQGNNAAVMKAFDLMNGPLTVSYTHLTLPTIYSV